MKLPTPQCFDCEHFRGAKFGKCDAFPDQIPERLWSGKFRHDKPFPGDQGIHYKSKITSEFLTISELAKVLNVNPKTIYRAVWSKRLPAYKIGKALRIADKDIELFRR